MCDPTALLDLVPGEGLLKRPSMDYNEYTYCYGGGRGGWHFFPRGSPGGTWPGTSLQLAERTRFSVVRASIAVSARPSSRLMGRKYRERRAAEIESLFCATRALHSAVVRQAAPRFVCLCVVKIACNCC